MSNQWIQQAHLRKGALSRKLGIPEDETIPMAKIKKAQKSKNPTTRKQAVLAENLKKMSSKKKGK